MPLVPLGDSRGVELGRIYVFLSAILGGLKHGAASTPQVLWPAVPSTHTKYPYY